MEDKYKRFLYSFIILVPALYIRIRLVLFAPFVFKIDAWSMYNYALNVVYSGCYGHCFGDFWARYAYWPPLYIFFSGFVYKLFGTAQNFIVMRLIQAVLSSISCLIAGSIADEALCSFGKYHREAGLITGLFMAFNQSMAVYANHLYTETIFIFIFLTAVYFGLRYIKNELFNKLNEKKSSSKYLIAFSVCSGVGNLTRPVLLMLPSVLFVSTLLYAASYKKLKKAWRLILSDAAIAVVIMLLVISPWTVRNYIVTGRIILVDTNGPINFYIAHNEHANGQWVDVKPYIDINSMYNTGYLQGLEYIGRNIGHEASLTAQKMKHIFFQDDYHITEAKAYLDKAYRFPFYHTLSSDIINESFINIVYKLPQVSYMFLWLISFLLFILFVIRLSAKHTLSMLFRETAWIIGNYVYVIIIMLVFYFAPRYRIIAEPLLCISVGIFTAGIFGVHSVKHFSLSRTAL